MVANLSACERPWTLDCLRGKRKEEILAIKKVRLNNVGMGEMDNT
jgi:hypothetical protein